ncbi:hypothetical protein GGI21_001532 [Coemansia aciculifera]|nr:hypothetical protein GGI21_001532 [Coemansia aciculifera]
MVSGKTAQALAQSPFAGLVFEAVRKVRVNFDSDSHMYSRPREYCAVTAASLYTQLMIMFPHTRTVYLTKCAMYSFRPVDTNCLFAQSIVDLHDNYRYADIASHWDLRRASKAETLYTNLTKLDMFCRHDPSVVPQLVRRCADSLEHLNLKSYQYRNNDNIFEDPNSGGAVEYHRLKTLKFFAISNESSSKHLARSPTIVLPRLTHLSLLGNYPFNDAVLFQSVSKTLVSVRLSTTMSLLDIINRFNVFSDTCCENTKFISIFSNWDKFYIEKYNSYYTFLSLVSRRLTSLKVSNAYVADIFMDLVMQVPTLDSIQALSIGGTVLSFNSLCSLIESLPQMTQLKFQSIEVYEDYDMPDTIDLYDHVVGKHAVLSANLQFCQVSLDDPLDRTSDLAICGILLSLMCPRFTRLIVCDTARSGYDLFIRSAIRQEPFSRYAERLSSLMFNDKT